MNEQIKLLADEAARYVDRFHADDTKESYWIQYKEKFAELLVRECGEFCGHDAAGVAAMFKHFGVTE